MKAINLFDFLVIYDAFYNKEILFYSIYEFI